MSAVVPLRFSKMHGAGNDFVLVDRRSGGIELAPERIARLADRHRGVGFDQLITIDAPRDAGAVAGYSIFNADGSLAGQCGNGARCVAAWLLREGSAGKEAFALDSPSGRIVARVDARGIGIDMGVPDFSPAACGLNRPDAAVQRFRVDGGEVEAVVVSMGNPHAVIEVPDAACAEVERIGRALQRDPDFSDSCNVGFAERIDAGTLRLRVYERGVGETLACGSGACAAVAAMAVRGRVGAQVEVRLPGGVLHIHWPGPGHRVRMTGPAEFVFEGEFLT